MEDGSYGEGTSTTWLAKGTGIVKTTFDNVIFDSKTNKKEKISKTQEAISIKIGDIQIGQK